MYIFIRFLLLDFIVILYKKKMVFQPLMMYVSRFIPLFPSPSLPAVSQGNDTDITGPEEKAESSRYSRSYTSGATLGAELRRGRSRRLSSSLQVLKGSTGMEAVGQKWFLVHSCPSCLCTTQDVPHQITCTLYFSCVFLDSLRWSESYTIWFGLEQV